MKIALYFGSFNPIHIGHMAIANYVLEFTEVDAVWFVISPQNPFKSKQAMLQDYHRLELVARAIGDKKGYHSSNIEFSMPKPSYTIDTITYLEEKYPDNEYYLIMGADNLNTFHKWKNADLLMQKVKMLVYPRPGIKMPDNYPESRVRSINAPMMEISSSFIREAIKNGKDVSFFLPKPVAEYIDEMNFYRK